MHCPTIEVDLAALARNYTLLASRHAKRACAAVVKANAYGLGVAQVASSLYHAGCREFFVATLEEGVELRKIVSADARIYVFHGARSGEQKDFAAHALIPVLNSVQQLEIWDKTVYYALHVDTGMCRLGVTSQEAIAHAQVKGNLKLLMSHLACAGSPTHPKNEEQRNQFADVAKHFGGVAKSLANSSGVFLGENFHHDLLRPGCSLYGISPNLSLPNPMEQVAVWSAPVLQYRHISQEQTVGYDAMGKASAGQVLATVELGYADGFQRILSNGKASAYANGVKLPLLGRVSMDMVTLDVTSLPENQRTADLRVEFIGKNQSVDDLAKAAGTIGYEIFTGLGQRVKRVYRNAPKSPR